MKDLKNCFINEAANDAVNALGDIAEKLTDILFYEKSDNSNKKAVDYLSNLIVSYDDELIKEIDNICKSNPKLLGDIFGKEIAHCIKNMAL